MWSDVQLAMLREMGIRVWAPRRPRLPARTERELEAALLPAASAANPAPPAMEPAAGPLDLHPPSDAAAIDWPKRSARDADWPALRAAVAACHACRLCDSRTQTVFGVGNLSAEWMIVGEAPGEQEDRQGEPFVGKSGQLLDDMLRALGLTRGAADPKRQVYIANTLKCRPPGNRNPEPDELARCEAFLIRQIELVRPKVLLAMGRFAVQSLLRSQEPVGRLRSRVHRYEGVPVVVTYHPAYLLRNPEDKAKAWEDLCLAAEVAGGDHREEVVKKP